MNWDLYRNKIILVKFLGNKFICSADKIVVAERSGDHLVVEWDPRNKPQQIEKLESKIIQENPGCFFLIGSPTVCCNEYCVTIYNRLEELHEDKKQIGYGNSIYLSEARLNAVYNYIRHSEWVYTGKEIKADKINEL